MFSALCVLNDWRYCSESARNYLRPLRGARDTITLRESIGSDNDDHRDLVNSIYAPEPVNRWRNLNWNLLKHFLQSGQERERFSRSWFKGQGHRSVFYRSTIHRGDVVCWLLSYSGLLSLLQLLVTVFVLIVTVKHCTHLHRMTRRYTLLNLVNFTGNTCHAVLLEGG